MVNDAILMAADSHLCMFGKCTCKDIGIITVRSFHDFTIFIRL